MSQQAKYCFVVNINVSVKELIKKYRGHTLHNMELVIRKSVLQETKSEYNLVESQNS